jgi:hypothetical protein
MEVRAIAFATEDLLGLPCARPVSGMATHVPSVSFQILLYILFISRLLVNIKNKRSP